MRTRLGLLVRIAIGVAVLLFAVQGGEYGTTDLLRQRAHRRQLQASLDSTKRVVDSLRRYRDRVLNDPKLQERIAREEFGMVRDHELLYRYVEPADSSADSLSAKP